MKKCFFILLAIITIPLTGHSQFVEWSQELFRENLTGEYYYHNDLRKVQSVQLADHSVVLCVNHTLTLPYEEMPYGYLYDSVQFQQVRADGSTGWIKTLPIPGRGKVYAMAATPDSGLIFCCTQGNDIGLYKIDKSGNPSLVKLWRKPVDKFIPCNLSVGPDGNYYILTTEFYFKEFFDGGYFSLNIFNAYFNLIKTDKAGNIAWIRNTGSDIVYNLPYLYPNPVSLDTSSIREVSLFTLLEPGPASSNTLSLVNSRAYGYMDSLALFINREIYLQQINTSGDIVLDRTLIDSFAIPSPDSLSNYSTTVKGYSFSYAPPICRTGNGYFFGYKTTYYVDSSDSNIDTYYYQAFDGNGNKTDSMIRQYVYDATTEPTGKAEAITLPLLADSSGNYWSVNYSPADPVYLSAGRLGLNQYDYRYELSARTEIKDQNIFAYNNVYNDLYFTPDSGFLCIHRKNYGNYYIDEMPGEGIFATKFGGRANLIKYYTYVDLNENGYRDPADTIFTDALLQTEHQAHTREYPLDAAAEGFIYTDTGTYISRLVSYYQRLKYYAINPEDPVSVFNNYGNRDTVVFKLTPKPGIQDLQVTIAPINTARPGEESLYDISVSNYGTAIHVAPVIKFLPDTNQVFIYPPPGGYTVSGDTIIAQLGPIAPLETLTFSVICRNAAPPILDAGDTLTLQAFILPVVSDSFPDDNTCVLRQEVRNSADPNDKLEAHGAGITATQLHNRDFLYYTIRFQNTGNDVANTVVVKDTLSDKLDWSTLEMLGASHPYTLNIQDKRYITWSFYGIYLPDSTADEVGSHGYIHFRIRPKAGLPNDVVFHNRASIIFDLNAAIVTNTAITQILQERVTSVKNPEIRQVKLYPSPTDSRFLLDIDLIQHKTLTLAIIDLSGKVRQSQSLKGQLGGNVFSIDISDQPDGLYLIRVNDDAGNQFYGKVLKQ